MGSIQFHVALSNGMSPIGPMYKAVSVREIRDKGTTWLTAKREGSIEELDGQTILNQIYDEVWFYMFFKLIFSSCDIYCN